MSLTAFEQRVLNDFQQDFPLEERPFKCMARTLESDEFTVLKCVSSLKKRGYISRIGPVFSPNTVGASTLAAISVEVEELDAIAAVVSSFESVNHNYQREHHYNLWFVVTASDKVALEKELILIEATTAYNVLSLPMLRAFHIDLGFDLNFNDHSSEQRQATPRCLGWQNKSYQLTSDDEIVVQVIQDGLPLCKSPYENLAMLAGITTENILATLQQLRTHGVIRRWGVVVRHHELGYRANAMVVWEIPDADIEAVAVKLAKESCVTLCYQRPRVLPKWPYNLFCMIHGKDRQTVEAYIAALILNHKLQHIPHETLFSTKRYKQRGARYRKRALVPLLSIGKAHA